MAHRGVIVTDESGRHGRLNFRPQRLGSLKRRECKGSDRWLVDEVYLRINGEFV